MTISEIVEPPAAIFSRLLRKYTLDEFWALPEPTERAHYELIGGFLFMAPAPDPPHGDVDAYLNRSLAAFLNSNGNPGNIYHPREAIYTEDTYVEPDMMYVSNELRAKMGKRRYSADIVFEYISKSNANYDRTTKADTYLALGVLELWLLDAETKTIEIRNAVAGASVPAWESRRFGAGENASSRVLAGWTVPVDAVFADL